MYCPSCGAEYREGFERCRDCDEALVPELPAPPEPRPELTFETVLESTDPGALSLAKSVLDAAGIEVSTVGENAGALFSGNPFFGRVRLQVESSRLEEAKRLLADSSNELEAEDD